MKHIIMKRSTALTAGTHPAPTADMKGSRKLHPQSREPIGEPRLRPVQAQGDRAAPKEAAQKEAAVPAALVPAISEDKAPGAARTRREQADRAAVAADAEKTGS